ncbi:lysozyme inhibitor LprI family protein [Roseovarius sp. MMSF_3281]|uniref:lysozyme inhibitor LprI family protein n=1 Tax=Roseovarius sp. MMSF_3281 TaxID=3046694 RepID=UPI00273F7FE6|nr:lysozyme inhibitor LprI family protein [Roseovarius sp. MMSF_3281]
MRVILVLLGMAAALPVVAQDFAVDGHRIDRCIAIQDDPMLCVGREAYDCIEANGGGPNMVLAACHEAEAVFWDAALNRAYQHLVYLAREREAGDVGYEAGALVTALRDMQRAWMVYRDASCDNALALAKPFGSAAGPAFAECQMVQTARQYFVLRGMRQDYLR